jgi:lipid II:glycine glycyltransferase (peptidoglycan interpeptide bridge formation enzyme)
MATVELRAWDDGAERWDAVVATSAHGHFLQSSAWASLRTAQGWSARRFEVRDDGGGLVGGAQVLTRRSRGGAVAYVPRGPVCEPGGAAWSALLPAMRESLRGDAVALRLEPHWADDHAARTALSAAGLREAKPTQPASTLLIDLSVGDEQLLAGMKQKWRYNVRLASRRGVVVEEGGRAETDEFERLMAVTAERDDFPHREAGYYTEVLRALGAAGRLYVARYEGEMLAGIVVVHFGDTATYLYGASSDAERQRMPNHLLQWVAMKRARESGCRWYDMWGVPDELGEAAVKGDDPAAVPLGSGGLWGVWGFKRGFGGQVVKYVGAWDDVYAEGRYLVGTRLVPAALRWARR